MRTKLPLLFLAVAALAFGLSLLWLRAEMPERLATHFSASGQADGWMTREQHLWGMVLLGFGLPAVVIGICYCIRFFPPSMLNVPKAAYWRSPAHYPEACGILLRWSYCVGAVSLVWTGLLHHQIVLANQRQPPVLAPQPAVAISSVYLAALGLLVVLLVLRFLKPGKE